jgi:hypothetical protein
MGHSVQLIIGKAEPVAAFAAHWPAARIVDLRGGWLAIPVDEALYHAIEAANPSAVRLPDLDAAPLGLGAALAIATTKGGALAYIETEFFGGTGGQSAMAIVDGRERMAPQQAKGIGPINQALRVIGVKHAADLDEFDTLGLGERRSMSDYDPEGPVRLRVNPPPASPSAPARTLPMWLVMILIAAAVGVGIMAAVVR